MKSFLAVTWGSGRSLVLGFCFWATGCCVVSLQRKHLSPSFHASNLPAPGSAVEKKF